ncbi:hypothetical protein SAMN05421770_10185 [Granulicella rosea]|uniref:Uncharacterized protein n=1 Tax=Granulicella rosea TaxID=474952 RepID=A0A239CSG2_9BACT|nr:hypothetical protein [Granulicella rosea]SNS23027.1 hypothetical protein SAMN05421770_10185 [Granulicella rosea]
MIPPITGASFPSGYYDGGPYSGIQLRTPPTPAAQAADTVHISAQALAAQASYRRATERKTIAETASDFALPAVQ